MHDKESEQFVDELLDASLRQFPSDEPRAGLEGRILASARTREGAARRRGVWTWVWALGAAAATLAVVVLTMDTFRRPARRAPSVPAPREVIASRAEAPKVAAAALPRVAARRTIRAPIRPAVVQLPRSDQFPTPVPLTEQEKLLLAFVEAIPKSQVLAETADQGTEEIQILPLTVAAIEIKPLPGPATGEEEK
jgi:hypothetical protein